MAKLFRSQTHVHKQVEVYVDDIILPDEVEFDETAPIFEIVYKNQRSWQVNVDMSDMEEQFQLLFNPAAVKDCKRKQDTFEPRIYTVKYTICCDDGKDRKTHADELELEIAPFKLDPSIEIEDLVDEFDYRSDMGVQKICDIVVRQPEQSALKFTPKQKIRLSLALKRNGSTQDITHRLHMNGATGGIDGEYALTDELRIPVYVDFSEFTNPVEDTESYIIVPKVDVYACFRPQEVKPQAFGTLEFELHKDPQGTELQIYTQCGKEPQVKFEGNRSGIQARAQFVPRETIGLPVIVTMANLATDTSNPRAGLRIKNLRVSHRLNSSGVCLIDDKGFPLAENLSKLFKLEGPDYEELVSGKEVFVRNGRNQETYVKLKFVPERLVKATLGSQHVYDFNISSVVTFDYWEDGSGKGTTSEADKKTANVRIDWELHLLPNKEWLCIDYGSSAIVCRYDAEVRDLHARKKQIFKSYKGGEYRENINDSSEKDSLFLSSDIVLTHQSGDVATSSLFSEQDPAQEIKPDNLAVCLSPTQSLIVKEVKNQLPCLKILVGNKTLPTSANIDAYQYRRRMNRDGAVGLVTMAEAEQNEEENSLMRIFNIFSEAYAELIHFYIAPESKGKDINKLVITYPTTYTPRHLRMLKQIVQANFKDLHPDYLKFVCESDAVAAYYINNWKKFNPKAGASIYNNDETVLVFDMGAGTLDLTLFKKTVKADGKIEVEILAKIGTGKAGNYLDYLIADIIVHPNTSQAKLYQDILKDLDDRVNWSDIVSLKSQAHNDELKARLDLKRLIKDIIKPQLKKDGRIVGTFRTHKEKLITIDLDSNAIIEDGRFQEYLLDVCGKLIHRLIKKLPGRAKKVDRILLSGRGCRLPAIRRTLNDFGVELTLFEKAIGKDADKTAVVDGAMAYADSFSNEYSNIQVKSRRLNANYGVAYRTLGEWKYVELLNSSELPTHLSGERLCDYSGSSRTIKGVQQAQKLVVIQTYMDQQETAAALNINDYEFITIMEEVSTDNFGKLDSLSVQLEVRYNNDIVLNVNGCETQGASPRGADLTSEITKRSVWPVII
ncbi:MAG: Hsp70 family protein [Muribaculaceae bacterium]